MPILQAKRLFLSRKLRIVLMGVLMIVALLLPLSLVPEENQSHEILAKRGISVSKDLSQAEIEEFPVLEGNTIISLSSPSISEEEKNQKILMIITAYSSTPEQTDQDPFITASGDRVRNGIVANNLLPFGTRIKIPALYGDRIFVVKDRMHWSKGYKHLDIWFPSKIEALNFGAKRAYIEVIEE